jgi:hypothetical protein
MGWFDDIPEDPPIGLLPEPPKPLKPRKASIATRRQIAQIDKVKKIEDGLLLKSMEVVDGVLDFYSIDPEEDMPEWFEKKHGKDAKRKWRLAVAGNKSAKEAPVAVKVSTQVAMGIVRARATEKSGPKILNIEKVQMVTTPLMNYPEQEVDE